MEKSERQIKFEQQTEKSFSLLGRFVMEFEHVVFTMRSCLERSFGKGPTGQFAVQALTLELSAYQLNQAFRSFGFSMQPTNLLAQSAISKFCKEFGDVIVLRNDLIHGTQFIGWASADQQDFDEPSMLRLKNTARGVKAISINISHNEMEANVARVKRLNLIAQAISTDFVIQRWEHHFDNAGTFIDSSVSQ